MKVGNGKEIQGNNRQRMKGGGEGDDRGWDG